MFFLWKLVFLSKIYIWKGRRFVSKQGQPQPHVLIDRLSSHVFDWRTSTGSEPFSLLICVDATKFVLLGVFTFTETICPKTCWKSPLPVDVGPSKTLLLKLPNKKAKTFLKQSHNAIRHSTEPLSRATSIRSIERTKHWRQSTWRSLRTFALKLVCCLFVT